MKTDSLIKRLTPDRETAEPSYLQVAQKLKQLIESGEIADGQSLPSERVLAERLQLSRTTVRRAYDELRANDYLATLGRAGVAVKAPPRLSPRLGRLKGFTEEMREMGMTPSTRLLAREILTDRTISSLFGRPTTARFLYLVRLRLGDGVPLSREVAWYDLTAAPELADWDVTGSAYQFLYDHCGIALTHGEQSIEAVISSDIETAVLGLPEPGPCLLMKRKTYSAARQMVEYVEGTFRGDVYAYRVTLSLNQPAA
ncbi:MAG: GntR family transcriptional regulator [Chromatiaceae bacterium]|jgi:GntR family transcriptional regulator|nr:GntR family transcriptional regulator [Chromatiaceae bacterium]